MVARVQRRFQYICGTMSNGNWNLWDTEAWREFLNETNALKALSTEMYVKRGLCEILQVKRF